MEGVNKSAAAVAPEWRYGAPRRRKAILARPKAAPALAFPPPFTGKGGSEIARGDFPPAGDRAAGAVEGARVSRSPGSCEAAIRGKRACAFWRGKVRRT